MIKIILICIRRWQFLDSKSGCPATRLKYFSNRCFAFHVIFWSVYRWQHPSEYIVLIVGELPLCCMQVSTQTSTMM